MQQTAPDQTLAEPIWLGRHGGLPRLVASRHRSTGRLVFPRLPEHSPAAPRYEPVTLAAEAILYSFTIIHPNPKNPNPKTGERPFVLAFADFPEGARVFGRLRLADGARPLIGARLRVLVEPRAEGGPVYVFVAAEEDNQ
jgi:uncharacterized OB-fold protein